MQEVNTTNSENEIDTLKICNYSEIYRFLFRL